MVELLVSIAVLSLLMILLLQVLDGSARVWIFAENDIETLRECRAALFTIAQDLRNARVAEDTPMVVNYPEMNADTKPDDLGTLFFFKSQPLPRPGDITPSNTDGDLAAVGYYHAYSVDEYAGDVGGGPPRSYKLYRYYTPPREAYYGWTERGTEGLEKFIQTFAPSGWNYGVADVQKYLFANPLMVRDSGDEVVARNIIDFKVQVLVPNASGDDFELRPDSDPANSSGSRLNEEFIFPTVTDKIIPSQVIITVRAAPDSITNALKTREEWGYPEEMDVDPDMDSPTESNNIRFRNILRPEIETFSLRVDLPDPE